MAKADGVIKELQGTLTFLKLQHLQTGMMARVVMPVLHAIELIREQERRISDLEQKAKEQ